MTSAATLYLFDRKHLSRFVRQVTDDGRLPGFAVQSSTVEPDTSVRAEVTFDEQTDSDLAAVLFDLGAWGVTVSGGVVARIEVDDDRRDPPVTIRDPHLAIGMILNR